MQKLLTSQSACLQVYSTPSMTPIEIEKLAIIQEMCDLVEERHDQKQQAFKAYRGTPYEVIT